MDEVSIHTSMSENFNARSASPPEKISPTPASRVAASSISVTLVHYTVYCIIFAVCYECEYCVYRKWRYAWVVNDPYYSKAWYTVHYTKVLCPNTTMLCAALASP